MPHSNESPKTAMSDLPDCWPPLPLASWQDTYATLHMWTQIVGKIRLALAPKANHWWNVPLYVYPRGLTTSAIPFAKRTFDLRFDFLDHKLVLETSDGQVKSLSLFARSVADFYEAFMDLLHSADIDVKIWKMPVEIPNPIPFDQDHTHASYDPESVRRFWQILVSVDRVFQEFRSRFLGKSSPVHFFWGSFDLAVTRFSGRRAPERPGADFITREAYSHEVSSVGFWPGSGFEGPAFYSYMAPEPPGFRDSRVHPNAAFYHPKLNEFILMYDAVCTAPSPCAALLDFCQSTYEAGAQLAHWDRPSLEKAPHSSASSA
ncbi:MAG TPA: DUF5996 family protein [Candidatus Dormibacteraeota bacterium]|jgi:hypothetical protein|nr:DUF5996 family protein [Candidatus Dormibacteraeota bacterium]